MKKIKPARLQCARCGWGWLPRREDVRLCPRCKSVRWDSPQPVSRRARAADRSRFRRIADALRARFGERLRRILFFGSRVRGDACPESDFDCLLVFDRVRSSDQELLDRLASEWLMEDGFVFAWVAVSETDVGRLRYEPFFRNAEREGLVA